jgi:hypothetical protein
MKNKRNHQTKDKTMKKLLTLVALVSLFFFGCDQESDLSSPSVDSPAQQFKLISIPAPVGGMSVEALFTKYHKIDGDDGGRFTAYFGYEGGMFGYVKVRSILTFEEDSFEEVKVISQTLDTEYAAMKFGPSMQFEEIVRLDLVMKGLDLSNVNPETLDFVYLNNDGSIEHIKYDSLTIDVSSGTIELSNAVLTHFSRYGFVNGQE